MKGFLKSGLSRRVAVVAIATGFAFLAMPASPVAAAIPGPPAGETSGGFGLATSGLIDIAPSATVSCPPANQAASALTATVGTIATASALYANCNGTTANSGAASATLLNNSIQLGAIESHCVNGVGSSSVLRIGPDPGLVTGPVTLNLSPLITLKLNETTAAGGETVQNALHLTILDNPLTVGLDDFQEVIIGQTRCATSPSPVVPEAPLTLLLPLSAVALFGGGFLVLRRRNLRTAA